MHIKEVKATIVLDSREEETIEVSVNGQATSAPAGKSKGKNEKPSYRKSLKEDLEVIKHLKINELPEVREFEHLEFIEKKVKNKIGANTLFALEASILKALADEQRIPLWKFLNSAASFFPRIISNTIGGGAHSNNKIRPDFQEFLVTCNKAPSIAKVVNKDCHDEAKALLKSLTLQDLKTNDENAWQTDLDNERVLEVMKDIQEDVFDETGVHVDVGLDCAASQFFKDGKYIYMNRHWARTRKQQIEYIIQLAKKYNLFYIEDPLEEEDFEGFAELVKNVDCLVVGDDLTTTNLERVEKAIKMEAITGIIIKPNQIGSLIETKKVIDLCKKNGIRTIMSHRSGETLDDTIADLAFAWQCDFIKIPVVGEERLAKVERLIDIELMMK
jgi:enolase